MGVPIPQSPDSASLDPQKMTPHQLALSLIARRDEIEKEIQEQQAILASEKTTSFSTPLVDAEGFPRADIDVYSIRLARVRIIELTNDAKDLTEQISKALELVHSTQRVDESVGGSSSVESSETPSLASLEPFARVDGVAPGSPADEAGLLREDLVLKFGSLSASSFTDRSLQPLATFVSAKENQPIQVVVRRAAENLRLTFTPRIWGGRGLLGCHIVPI